MLPCISTLLSRRIFCETLLPLAEFRVDLQIQEVYQKNPVAGDIVLCDIGLKLKSLSGLKRSVIVEFIQHARVLELIVLASSLLREMM